MDKRSTFPVIGISIFTLLMMAVVVFALTSNGVSREKIVTGLSAENVLGDVSIRRNGSNYTLKSGEVLFPDDEIMVGRAASCEIVAEGRVRATMDRDSKLRIRDLSDDCVSLEVTEGSAFFDMVRNTPDSRVTAAAGDAVLTPETGSIFSVEAYTGTQTFNLYAGAGVLDWEGEEHALGPKDHVTVFRFEETAGLTTADVLAPELSGFLLDELILRSGVCFQADQLRSVLDRRRADTVAAVPQTGERMVCSVEIRCDSILGRDISGDWTPPADGVLMPATPVKFTRGESVYDVLRRVCKNSGLDINYNFLPMISGYYITRIGGLQELDCGPNSGWLYRVNGWYPNYGPSKYEVEEGDVIVWAYSCDGGADDLGREKWEIRQ